MRWSTMVRRAFFYKKGQAHIDLIADLLLFILIVFLLFFAIMLLERYKESVEKELTYSHASEMYFEYNVMAILRQTVSDEKYVSDLFRDFCLTGRDAALNEMLKLKFPMIMKEGHEYKIEIEKEHCNDNEYSQTIKKGDFKKKYFFINDCPLKHQTQVILPNYNATFILITITDTGCEK